MPEPECLCIYVDIGVGQQRVDEHPECPVHVEPVYSTEPYPCAITVYCDGCGIQTSNQFVVNDAMQSPARLGLARAHLRTNEGWTCDASGDHCPGCTPEETGLHADPGHLTAISIRQPTKTPVVCGRCGGSYVAAGTCYVSLHGHLVCTDCAKAAGMPQHPIAQRHTLSSDTEVEETRAWLRSLDPPYEMTFTRYPDPVEVSAYADGRWLFDARPGQTLVYDPEHGLSVAE